VGRGGGARQQACLAFDTRLRIFALHTRLRIIVAYTHLRMPIDFAIMLNEKARTARQLGAIVRRSRRAAGWTQAELGRRIGRRQATISKLEAGKPTTQLQTLLDALMALNLEICLDHRTDNTVRDLGDVF